MGETNLSVLNPHRAVFSSKSLAVGDSYAVCVGFAGMQEDLVCNVWHFLDMNSIYPPFSLITAIVGFSYCRFVC